MKRGDISCASQVATSVCLSIEETSSSSATTQLALITGQAIDRYNPIIRDSKRLGKSLPPCNSQQPPISPQQRKKQPKKNQKNLLEENDDGNKNGAISVMKSWSCTRPGNFISPASSSRYLLSDKGLLGGLSDPNPGLDPDLATQSGSHAELPSEEQVVVLKVSLDCRGCEKKLRRHLSKMEAGVGYKKVVLVNLRGPNKRACIVVISSCYGVTSFSIDFVGKKVTVNGNVNQSSVLASISKLRNAKSWSPAPLNSDKSQLKKEYREVATS